MTIELFAVLLTAAFQSALLTVGIVMLYRMGDDRRVEQVLREMREELRKAD